MLGGVGFFLLPILCIIFCFNLIRLIEKIVHGGVTFRNTCWMTGSFTMIVMILASLALMAADS